MKRKPKRKAPTSATLLRRQARHLTLLSRLVDRLERASAVMIGGVEFLERLSKQLSKVDDGA